MHKCHALVRQPCALASAVCKTAALCHQEPQDLLVTLSFPAMQVEVRVEVMDKPGTWYTGTSGTVTEETVVGRRGLGPLHLQSMAVLVSSMLEFGEGLTVGPDSDGLLNLSSQYNGEEVTQVRQWCCCSAMPCWAAFCCHRSCVASMGLTNSTAACPVP